MKKIRMDEYLNELEKHRRTARNLSLPDEQMQVIISARTGEAVVSWINIVRLFERWGWGKYSCGTLQKMYDRAIAKQSTTSKQK